MAKECLSHVFRVDAGIDRGIGHFRRCLALGESIQHAGGSVAFVMAKVPTGLKRDAEAKRIKVVDYKKKVKQGSDEDSRLFLTHLDSQKFDWIIFDGYGFHKQYRENVNRVATHSLVIQDSSGDYTDADFVLDQNVNIDTSDYHIGNRGKFLTGPEYSLVLGVNSLRNERLLRKQHRMNILVTLGGADVKGLTLPVVESLMKYDVNINVVLGPVCPWNQSDFDGFEDKLNVHVSPNGLDKLIAGADIGVMSMGITTWEMCFYGLPFIMLGCNRNQQPIIDWFVERELAINGLYNGEFVPDYFVQSIEKYLHNPARQRAYSENLMQVVDGLGPDRVVKEISNIA